MVTRANLEAELIDRCGALLTLVSKDGTTIDGTNASLTGPLREGLGSLGLTTTSFATVTDADLLTVTSDQLPQLLDTAELRILLNVDAAYLKVDSQVDRDMQKLGQIRDGLKVRIFDLRKSLKDTYGIGLGTLSFGTITFDFAEVDETNAEEFG